MAGAAAGRRIRLLEHTAAVIPDRLARLPELARDLWWTWNKHAREVFRKLDYPLWRQTAHNPVLMLGLLPQEILDRVRRRAVPPDLRRRARGARRGAQRARHLVAAPLPDAHGPIAYFSAEFALHQSLPIYAGGLGVLAGDHCKEASDLGIPLIGVGFMYPQGYFHQSVSPEGWQQEIYEHLNWTDAPIEPAITPRASRASSRCRSAAAACSSRSGACGSAA
jgi:glycogen phosphorylase